MCRQKKKKEPRLPERVPFGREQLGWIAIVTGVVALAAVRGPRKKEGRMGMYAAAKEKRQKNEDDLPVGGGNGQPTSFQPEKILIGSTAGILTSPLSSMYGKEGVVHPSEAREKRRTYSGEVLRSEKATLPISTP